jgi:hypothetical protein
MDCLTVEDGTDTLSRNVGGSVTNYQPTGRDSLVGISTGYVLDGPGIESRWGVVDFAHPSRPAHPASYTVVTGSLPGLKQLGRGVDH